jgi:CheY-like chemotaxis protein
MNKKILVVEDEEAMAKALMSKLVTSGFIVTLAKNGEEALQNLAKERFDCVLLDILMPVKDGYTVLIEKKQTMNADTKVCVLTCLGQEESLTKAKGLGADICFIKSQTSLHQVVDALKNL